MQPRKMLETLTVAERLKDTTRHCYTAKGRQESVAEHSWMMCLMAFLMKDEFPDADMDKVIKMCIIHDLGECFTGDIPAFDKTDANRHTEDDLLNSWVENLPQPYCHRMKALYAEMNARETLEAKIYKAIDSMEAVIQHNISPLETWTENELEFNKTYAFDRVGFSDYTQKLREEILKDTIEKLK